MLSLSKHGVRFFSSLLVLCPINKLTQALKFGEDGVRSGRPDEGARVGIVVSDVGVDLLHEFADTAERSAPNRLLGDEREPALDLVEPAGVGRREVQVKTRMADEPGLHLGMLVGRVVVHDEVQVEGRRNVGIEVLQKAEELLMAMARLALPEDVARENVQRGK